MCSSLIQASQVLNLKHLLASDSLKRMKAVYQPQVHFQELRLLQDSEDRHLEDSQVSLNLLGSELLQLSLRVNPEWACLDLITLRQLPLKAISAIAQGSQPWIPSLSH